MPPSNKILMASDILQKKERRQVTILRGIVVSVRLSGLHQNPAALRYSDIGSGQFNHFFGPINSDYIGTGGSEIVCVAAVSASETQHTFAKKMGKSGLDEGFVAAHIVRIFL